MPTYIVHEQHSQYYFNNKLFTSVPKNSHQKSRNDSEERDANGRRRAAELCVLPIELVKTGITDTVSVIIRQFRPASGRTKCININRSTIREGLETSFKFTTDSANILLLVECINDGEGKGQQEDPSN